ncbi:MAG TPA: thioesterase family protein [Acidimicrobiales bacterium]|nr:thioesterase family protein [Acidimicrobiales bacterium]
MAPEFDDDTALTRQGDTWHANVSNRWHIGSGPNGGYMASFPLRAMLDISPFPDPLSMTSHFLQRPAYAPATLRATVVHATRGHAFLHATMEQEHGTVVTATAVFGTHRPGGPEVVDGAPPIDTAPDDCPVLPVPEGMPFVERFTYRVPAEQQAAFLSPEPAPAHVFGWVRLADRDIDTLALPLVMDSFPPAVFAAFGPGLAPTLELTVHFRAKPTTRWHLADFRTRFLMGGYMEEDGELWDEDGRLVAQSRQLARFTAAPQG